MQITDDRLEILELLLNREYSNSELRSLCDHCDWDAESIIGYLAKLPIQKSAKSLMNEIIEHRVQFVFAWEPGYPVLLRQTHDPPAILYYRGDLQLASDRTLAIVGSRKISGTFVEQTTRFATYCADSGLSIVSGLAFGADAAAHTAVLNAGGSAIAVLPGPVDLPVPSAHTNLLNSIAKKGLVLSEVPPGGAIYKGSFPRRNRLIAGISQATLVTAAGAKSGALITARLANSYGREVFTLPGGMTESITKGNNLLLKSLMAKLVEEPDELLKEMGIETAQTHKLDQNSESSPFLMSLAQRPKTASELAKEFDKTIGDTLSLLTILQVKGQIYLDEMLRYYPKQV